MAIDIFRIPEGGIHIRKRLQEKSERKKDRIMIDWEAAESSRLIKSADNLYEEQGVISRKAAVYLIIFALIVILCGVYVMQFRNSRRAAQAPTETVTVSEEASTAMTAEVAEAEEQAK